MLNGFVFTPLMGAGAKEGACFKRCFGKTREYVTQWRFVVV
ncbi:hypothetical protein ABID23_000936 [Bartonella silvatica]|uniref:Uncharacterized protein n=1 Tax=Bartonella silvatica TaxID=357760 RepID=A0ABV2HH78_9HYPH